MYKSIGLSLQPTRNCPNECFTTFTDKD